jgi:hypothetical protein
LDKASATKNMFGILTEKYGNEDAARAAIRTSSLDYAAVRAKQLADQHGGVESANARDELVAKLDSERERTIAAGYKFIPPTVSGPRYAVAAYGQRMPGTYSEKEAQAFHERRGVAPVEQGRHEAIKGGIQMGVEEAKHRGESQKDLAPRQVVVPSGQKVTAPSTQEADKLRDITLSVRKTDRLVDQAIAIRARSGFRMSPEDRAKLSQIQADLVTGFAVQNQLGALSASDMDLAMAGTSDLLQIGSGAEAKLNRLKAETYQKLSDRVSSYDGAPPLSTAPPSAKKGW